MELVSIMMSLLSGDFKVTREKMPELRSRDKKMNLRDIKCLDKTHWLTRYGGRREESSLDN
jgi:hypothetical protein